MWWRAGQYRTGAEFLGKRYHSFSSYTTALLMTRSGSISSTKSYFFSEGGLAYCFFLLYCHCGGILNELALQYCITLRCCSRLAASLNIENCSFSAEFAFIQIHTNIRKLPSYKYTQILGYRLHKNIRAHTQVWQPKLSLLVVAYLYLTFHELSLA